MNRTVLWTGIVLMPIRIRILLLMPIQIRIRIGIKTMRSLCGSYPKFYTCRKIRICFYFWSQHCHFTKYYLSHQCQSCHKFSILWMAYGIEIFWKKVYYINWYFICLELISIRIQIRQNDADPTRSGSATLESRLTVKEKTKKKHIFSMIRERTKPNLTSMQ